MGWIEWNGLWSHASIDTHHETSLPTIVFMAAHCRLECIDVKSWVMVYAWNFESGMEVHVREDLQHEKGLLAVDDALAQDRVERLGFKLKRCCGGDIDQ